MEAFGRFLNSDEIGLLLMSGSRYVATIDMTRHGERRLDDDNLESCFKAIRDGIADALGVNDASDRMVFRPHQKTGADAQRSRDGRNWIEVAIVIEEAGVEAKDQARTTQKQKPLGMEPLMLDAKAVGALLGCSATHVRRRDDLGEIPTPLKIGKLVRWRREELEAWIRAGCPRRVNWTWSPANN